MSEITTIGLDLTKNIFQVHGVDETETVVVVKRLRRNQIIGFFAGLPRHAASAAVRAIISSSMERRRRLDKKARRNASVRHSGSGSTPGKCRPARLGRLIAFRSSWPKLCGREHCPAKSRCQWHPRRTPLDLFLPACRWQ
jgi:hypothetical protein